MTGEPCEPLVLVTLLRNDLILILKEVVQRLALMLAAVSITLGSI